MIRLLQGDCQLVLPTLAAESVDAIVTDPPAGIGFMGKAWDGDKGGRDHWIAWMQGIAAECLRVLKPGGHALVWALPRTSHWTATAWENAGFEVRDRVAHLFGSGFPKSLDVSKAIDKAAGVEREVVGPSARHVSGKPGQRTSGLNGSSTFAESVGMGSLLTAPATEAARQWQGWGTALKPAMEDWWLVRKPLAKGCTVAANVLRHGTGGLNIDGCRIEGDKGWPASESNFTGWSKSGDSVPTECRGTGRWPANLCTDGSDEVIAAFPQSAGQAGRVTGDEPSSKTNAVYGAFNGRPSTTPRGDTGSAARFFFSSKASRADRNEGLEGAAAHGYVLDEAAPPWIRGAVEALLA